MSRKDVLEIVRYSLLWGLAAGGLVFLAFAIGGAFLG